MEGGKNYRRALGSLGEDIVCEFLRGKGHVVMERNWRWGHLEIDIISFAADGIHFVEVKTRRLNIQAPPQDNVGHLKQSRTAKAALRYLNTEKGQTFGDQECHFDVVAVTFDGDSANTEWIPDAFIPLYI